MLFQVSKYNNFTVISLSKYIKDVIVKKTTLSKKSECYLKFYDAPAVVY